MYRITGLSLPNPTFVVCSIAGLTLYLFLPPLLWFGQQIVIDPFSGLLLLMLPVAWYFRPHAVFQLQPLTFARYPGVLFWLLITAYLLNENYLGIHIFSAALFIGSIYSLLGLVLSGQQWRALFFPFCLLVLALPFEGYLDVYLGFPLRLLCADWAGQVLQILGFTSMSHESIIMIEEKAANVDLGCSGIKGLWAGSLFFVLLSMIEGHRVSWRWLAIGVGFAGCLLFANVLRIVVLVLIGVVANFTQFADLVHQCMGLLGFAVSCALAWLALRLSRRDEPKGVNVEPALQPSLSMASIFIGGLLVALWLHQPYQPGEVTSSQSFELADDLQLNHLALSELEKAFFTSNQASVSKLRFDFEGITGSVLVVSSRYWKAQHEPHNCYVGQGLSLGFEGSWLLANASVVRFLHLDGASKTAVYWFQSAQKITPDYSARVFDGVINPHNVWLMVSILLDRQADKIQVEQLLLSIQSSLAEQLIAGGERG